MQLLLFCFAFCRVSFIQGNICFVRAGVALLEALLDGDFFFWDAELLGLGEDADSGGACCSPIVVAWLLLL